MPVHLPPLVRVVFRLLNCLFISCNFQFKKIIIFLLVNSTKILETQKDSNLQKYSIPLTHCLTVSYWLADFLSVQISAGLRRISAVTATAIKALSHWCDRNPTRAAHTDADPCAVLENAAYTHSWNLPQS